MPSSFWCRHLISHIVHKVRTWRRPRSIFQWQYPCKLPIELWVLIFQCTEDGQTMTHVMCLNHAFRHMVETIRYRSVTLDDRSALLFFATLRSRPVLAALVNSLYLDMLNLKRTPDLLSELARPSTLNTLINLRSLSLTVCSCGGHKSELKIGWALTQSHFLHLRAFRTNLDHAMIQLVPFFAAHPQLTELDVASVPFSKYLEDEVMDLNLGGAQLPSLRALATPSVFLRAGLPIPSHLQHLHLSCDIPPLRFVASILGTQLLSLRLLALPLVDQASGSQLGPYEIRLMFPRLRFLQVDMILGDSLPTLPVWPINWHKKRTHSECNEMSQDLVTVAWVYTEDDKPLSLEASFLETSAELLRASAVELLNEWGHIVDKIVCLVPRSPAQYIYSDLDTMGPNVTNGWQNEDPDEYWKAVSVSGILY